MSHSINGTKAILMYTSKRDANELNYKPKIKLLTYLDTLQPEIIHDLCFSFEYMVLGCFFYSLKMAIGGVSDYSLSFF